MIRLSCLGQLVHSSLLLNFPVGVCRSIRGVVRLGREHALVIKGRHLKNLAEKTAKAIDFFFFFLIVCFTSYFVFSIAVLSHSPGVVYYHLLLRRETGNPRVAPFSFRIGIWDLFVHRGQKSYTPTAFGKVWTTPGVRCMKHASS